MSKGSWLGLRGRAPQVPTHPRAWPGHLRHLRHLTLGLTLDLVNDPSEPPLHLPTFQPVLPPDEDEVEEQQEEQRRGVHQLHPVAGRKG